MPKAPKKKPVAPTAPKAPEPTAAPAPAANGAPGLPVLYDRLDIKEYSTAVPRGPLGVDDIVTTLGWETEKEYQARKVRENPGTKPEHYLFGDTYHCLDVSGQKVRCNHNAHNRPFDVDWCKALMHTVLSGQWAGPYTVPGETVNGETVRISRYGRVLSGQHSMTACKLADEWLQKARKDLGLDAANEKYPTWAGKDHCFLETIVITGMSEDPRVLMTVDYVKPRTAADVFYTSEVFKSSTPNERKELCRMLASAVDLLWTRTDARGYKTHPEIVGFLERHKRLMKCVEHLFKENSEATGRKIAKLRLVAGQCAALCYLMGCSATTDERSDEYRNESPPTEKGLDWTLWDHAHDFWSCLANSPDFLPVRKALGLLLNSDPTSDDNLGMGGHVAEKFAILAKAWEVYKDHPTTAGSPFSDDDLVPDGCLTLNYVDVDDRGNKLPDGRIKLVDVADFYGVDCPDTATPKAARSGPPQPPPPTREEIEKATADAHARRAAAQAAKK